MSYKSEWIAILAKFKASIKTYLTTPSDRNAQNLEKSKNDFVNFVEGYSALLGDKTYDVQVIRNFNQAFTNQETATASADNNINNLQNLIDSIDNAIANNKEEEGMTNNFNISGNAQIGDNNTQTNNQNTTNIDINLQTLINEIEKSGDKDAKNKLLDLFNNGTIASIVGITASEVAKFFG